MAEEGEGVSATRAVAAAAEGFSRIEDRGSEDTKLRCMKKDSEWSLLSRTYIYIYISTG